MMDQIQSKALPAVRSLMRSGQSPSQGKHPMHKQIAYSLTPLLCWLTLNVAATPSSEIPLYAASLPLTALSLTALSSTSRSSMSFSSTSSSSVAHLPKPGALLYEAEMQTGNSVNDWIMEGKARTEFRRGWMEMYSPNQAEHHVLWCPQAFPASFIATWEVQNLAPDAGLLIVFFAAKGDQGQDIFDASLPARDGTFTHYTEGKIKSYHISYYANVAHEPGRVHANLRKNNTFSLLQAGAEGIPTNSTDVHKITLIKQRTHIRLLIDGRTVIDYVDDQPVINGVNTGPALGSGKIGLRQMRWSHFRYRNFKVWEIASEK